MKTEAKTLPILGLVAALVGLAFAIYSTNDYAAHLDRQIHEVHCSFIPGASSDATGENPCKVALFSPYSALFRGAYWGGIPISLFALGSFSFFVGTSVYWLLMRARIAKKSLLTIGALGFTPLLASLVMFTISATKLHTFCKVCVGIYLSSLVLAFVSGQALRGIRTALPSGDPRPEGKGWFLFAGLGALGAMSLVPAAVYASSLPDYKPYLSKCGKLAVPTESHQALLKLKTEHPVRAVTLFEDPLCPTCKAFHERIVDEGIFERLDVTLALFPLDNECNWMLDRSLHPGACLLSKVILCSGDEARHVMEWSFDNQEELFQLGKANQDAFKRKVADRWGATMMACAAEKKTEIRLNHHLHYASNNHIPVSTPQMFLGELRICDEDTDLGLKYTMTQLAPEVLP